MGERIHAVRAAFHRLAAVGFGIAPHNLHTRTPAPFSACAS